MKVLSDLSEFFCCCCFFPWSPLTGEVSLDIGERCELQAGNARDFPHNAHKVWDWLCRRLFLNSVQMEKNQAPSPVLSRSLQTEDLYEETSINGRVSQVSSSLCDGHTDTRGFPCRKSWFPSPRLIHPRSFPFYKWTYGLIWSHGLETSLLNGCF